MYILALFILAQVLDGVFTYHGVRHGHPEGNAVMNAVFHHVGLLTGILWAKALSILLGIFIHVCDGKQLMLCLTIFFWMIAVLPWMFVFLGVW